MSCLSLGASCLWGFLVYSKLQKSTNFIKSYNINTMTVGELISNLKQYDPELEVKFTDGQVFYRSKDRGGFVGIEIGTDENDDKKSPKEASNIFHSIMKASVTPKKEEEKKVVPKPKQKK